MAHPKGGYHVQLLSMMGGPDGVPPGKPWHQHLEDWLNTLPGDFQTGYQWPWDASKFMAITRE
jgi:hypothetical protein